MKYIYTLFLALLLLGACDDIERCPIDHDGTDPQPVTNVQILPLPGGAQISYTLPTDTDLSFVEAVYTLPNGSRQRVNASYNTPKLSVEGFAEVKEYEVELTCVDRSGNRSTPYLVKFTPLTPPVLSVFETIKMQPDFGGINLQWENPTAAELAIIVSKKDEAGDYVTVDTYYTSVKEGSYTVRGQEIEESEFRVRIRDKWNNFSESKEEVLLPIYEAKLDRNNFRSMGQGYVSRVSDHSNVGKLWDKDFENNVFNGSQCPWYASFTIGEKPARLSRIVIWQYAWPFNNYGHYYAGGNGRIFELWAWTDPLAEPSTDMEGWMLIQTCEIVKPSGLPSAIGRDNMTDEDYDLAKNKGHEFNVPLEIPSVRYLRLVGVESYEGILGVCSEIEFYGDPR